MVALKPCPFCGVGDERLVVERVGGFCVACEECGATGPEAATDREARAEWNDGCAEYNAGTERERRLVAVDPDAVHVKEEPHPDYEGAVTMTLLLGNRLLCEVAFCTEALAPTLRGALLLMGSTEKAKELERH